MMKYNSISVPSNSVESIESSIYSDTLDQIKSILLNVAFVHAEIGDEISFSIPAQICHLFDANTGARLSG